MTDPSHDPHDSRDGAEDRVIHEVDGIQEYDNHLPNWWLVTLYGAIVFAAMYWFYFHVFNVGELPGAAYRRDITELAEGHGKSVPVTSEALLELTKDPSVLAEGASLFASTCAPCHGPKGGGIVGPNLTDDFWLHGGGPQDIFASVREGYPLKGMLAWGPQLGPKRVEAVVAYVLTLRNTNVPGGKPPQGEKHANK